MARVTSCKRSVDVKINDFCIAAILDTGSDLTVMRADQYIKIGAPKLNDKKVPFRGVGTESNMTLGEFDATIKIDGHTYPILIRVISDELSRHQLLVGRDFLDKIDLNVRLGVATVRPVLNEPIESNVPDIYQIDVCADHAVSVNILSTLAMKNIERLFKASLKITSRFACMKWV